MLNELKTALILAFMLCYLDRTENESKIFVNIAKKVPISVWKDTLDTLNIQTLEYKQLVNCAFILVEEGLKSEAYQVISKQSIPLSV